MSSTLTPPAPAPAAATRWIFQEPDGTAHGPFATREQAQLVRCTALLGTVLPLEEGSELARTLDQRASKARQRDAEQRQQRETELRTARELAQQEMERQMAAYHEAEKAKAEAKRQIDLEKTAAGTFEALRDGLRFPWRGGHGEKVADAADRAKAMMAEAFAAAERDWRAGPAYKALAELRPMRDSLAGEADRARAAADKAESEYQAAIAGDDAAAAVKARGKRDTAQQAARGAAAALADFQRGRFDPADAAARQDWCEKHTAAVDGLRKEAERLYRPPLPEVVAALLAAVPGAALGDALRRLLPYHDAGRLIPPMPPE